MLAFSRETGIPPRISHLTHRLGVTEGPSGASVEEPRRNPFLFLVGCPRSGTTLLKRMVGAHLAIAIPSESHWIPRLHRRRVGLAADDTVTPAIVDALAADRRFPRLGIDTTELSELVASRPGIRYGELVGAFFDRYGEREGKALVGDKTPGYVAHLPLLHRLFPTARFVHIIRDGRDVCLSSLSWDRAYKNAGRLTGYGEDPITVTALWWERFVTLGTEDGAALGPARYLEVRYESLVADPEGECRRVCEFLGLPWNPAMLRYHEGRSREDWDTGSRAWMPPTPGLRDWRSQLPADDVLRFEAAAGERLSTLGYERRFAEIPEELRANAQRRRAAVAAGLGAARLPRGWKVGRIP